MFSGPGLSSPTAALVSYSAKPFALYAFRWASFPILPPMTLKNWPAWKVLSVWVGALATQSLLLALWLGPLLSPSLEHIPGTENGALLLLWYAAIPAALLVFTAAWWFGSLPRENNRTLQRPGLVAVLLGAILLLLVADLALVAHGYCVTGC